MDVRSSMAFVVCWTVGCEIAVLRLSTIVLRAPQAVMASGGGKKLFLQLRSENLPDWTQLPYSQHWRSSRTYWTVFRIRNGVYMVAEKGTDVIKSVYQTYTLDVVQWRSLSL